MHHLKKTFTKKEKLFIRIMYNRHKPKQYIATQLNCSFDRVKREIEIINFQNKSNE